MKKGKKSVEGLGEYPKYEILKEITDLCIKYAGDSYEDFARPVIKLLVKSKLVEYGE